MNYGCECPDLIHINKIHTFFKADFKSDYAFKGERHNWWEMVFVINGTVGITAGGDVFNLSSSQAVIHKPMEFHKICSEPQSPPSVIVISFSASVFPEIQGKIFSLTSSEIEEIQSLYELSLTCFERNNIYLSSCIDGGEVLFQKLRLRLELLIFSLIYDNKQRETSKIVRGLKSAELYSGAVKFMEENFGEGYCIEDIAARFSISSAYLKKIFIKYAGCGVMQYYNRLRARLACSYLASGKTVKETADILGFSDQNYFSTFFKRHTGKSPTSFKKGI